MLDIVRANKKGIFSWLIVLGIVVVFAINFGPGSLSKGGAGCGGAPAYAARVNGKSISAADFERQYENLLRFYQQQAGEGFTRELAAQLGLGRQALGVLEDRELALQEARRRGVVVTDREVSEAVHQMPAFQENGQFRYETYLEAVRANYGSPGNFEAAVRDDLLYQKILGALVETVKVPATEVRAQWAASADRASLQFVRFPVAAAQAEVKVPDADAKAFADKEGARVEAFYKENADRYDPKAKVHVRHVLARLAPGASADEEAAARKKIDEAAARVKKGEDFAKVAAALSDDPNTKDRGGDLGFVSEGLADAAFAKAALALKAGEVSEPVRTPAGWHLIRADEVVPARKVTLEAARLDIARELLARDRAQALAREKAQAALDAARKGKALDELFPPAGKGKQVTLGGTAVAAEETGPFGAGSPVVPRVGAAPELAQAALSAKAGEVLPKVFDTPSGPVIAVVKLRESPDPARFEAERAGIEARLQGMKAEQVRRAWLEELRGKAKIEENVALLGAAQPAAPQP
ncbi:PpiC-type peptidyl-prolyl cis-trans isomerase [Anaeromyxobacter sp. K]|uniref:peptidylprolyl isomerase n=1 Tax=Anaeromyxobacter sp. (strain K) TaxID=447217 RepID=UPI00015F8CE3|nr:peptidylprolyl isomerase [Anaeromyxobacter sp. K]ACG72585.1 PpiC-type peptidyl-prolyl cis-trans isomerase [Anaeromyxobacter sp. K]